MNVEVKVPGFPESVSDGSIVTWHKKPGDRVMHDEILVDIETDKVMFEVPAPADGILKEIIQDVGKTVISGQILAVLDTSQAPDLATAEPEESAPHVMKEESDQKIFHISEAKMAPAARKLISENNIDPAQLNGSGKDGRILKEDVMRYLQQSSNDDGLIQQAMPGPESVSVQRISPEIIFDEARPEKRVPMTRLRARIAERLLHAQHTAAMLTTFNEVNMQPVMELRKRYQEIFEKEHGVRLGFMSFFVKAAVEALKRFPVINASIDGNDIVYHGYFDIGIAVSSLRGLVVPILRDADQLGMPDIEKSIIDYAGKAKEGTLALEDITGGTFTITNGGIFGSMLSTPILNPPQSAILGMHKIEQRPVVENGEIVIRPIMYLALSYDHRIIDGREAVQFLVTIKEQLEDPARMMLGI